MCRKKIHSLVFNLLLLFLCQRTAEMKSFVRSSKYSNPCLTIGENEGCICQQYYKPCIFEDKSGYPDPYDAYRICVKYDRTHACCPYGWSYNEYSVDVNCIGFNETIAGYGAVNRRKEKRCTWDSNPSCRKQSIRGNKIIIDHICQKNNIPCNGRCYNKDMKVCHSNKKCMSQYMWNTGCNDAKTSITPNTSKFLCRSELEIQQ